MINKVVQMPKINDRLLPPMSLKQGDNVSPILFDTLFDYVEEVFDDSYDPIKLSNGLAINHLFYADDMSILLLSSEGFQNSLNDTPIVISGRWRLVQLRPKF